MGHAKNAETHPHATTLAAPTEALPAELDFQPVDVATRSRGWTPERQRAFIEELADCGVVREAAARVGMTEQSAHRIRRRPDSAAFNAAWETAMRMGADRLRSIAVERAIEGTVRRRYYRGEVVGEERVFDNRLLLYLLARSDNPGSEAAIANRLGDWSGLMEAIEDGHERSLPPPDERWRSPVWREDDGRWITRFPPPEGFEGDAWGDYGDDDYCRELDPAEWEAVQEWQRRSLEAGMSQRETYFRRLGTVGAEGSGPKC